MSYSLRSAIEVVSCLFNSKKRGYINEADFKELYDEYEILVKMITSLKNSF
ncbi:MAG: four helix bundle protein [Mucilaginibacter sp.]